MTTILTLLAIWAALALAAHFGLHRKVVPVFYKSLPSNKRGYTNGLWIVVGKGIPWQESTLEHELEHVRQSWTLGIVGHALAYKFSKRYRVWAETKAYGISHRYGRPAGNAALALSRLYGVPYDEAFKDIITEAYDL